MKGRVLDIARNLFQHEVCIDSKINDFERWDSLGQLTLFMALENELGIKFTHEEIIDTDSINKIISLIDKKNA
jgi:acyl carrier protein